MDLMGKLSGAVDKDQQPALLQANLKMHVLLVISNKEEGKLADKIYDPKFSKITTVLPETKPNKLPKDVHAIVAWCGRDDLTKIGNILDGYSKYLIKAIIGKQSEDVKTLQEQGWSHFEFRMPDDVSKLEPLKQYLKGTFDKEVTNIRNIFQQIDEDGNKYLSPFELTLVSQQLGKPLSKEEIDECVKIIDTDGNGQITFDEFAMWWIGGREGAPEGLGNQLANFMAKSQKFTNLAMRQLNQTLKTTQGLEEKDLRNFQLKFKVGKYEDKDSGITLDAKFGIVDSKQEPVLGYKETLGFTDKESWFMIKFHIDDDETPEEVLEKVKNYKVIQLLQKYAIIYNRQENVQQGKFEVKSDKKSIIIGLQGGHQLNNMKQNYISIFDPVFEKIIQLQKKSNLQNFYQSLVFQSDFGTNLVDLLSSKDKIIDELMKGLQFKVGFNLLSKMDDIIMSVIQYYEEMMKKTAKEEGKKADDPEKIMEKKQRHMLHILSVIMKTKMSAQFELDYVEDFQNNILSLIGDGSFQEYLNTTPGDALPFLAEVKKEFEEIKGSKEGIPEVVDSVSEILSSFMEGLGLNEVFSEMINFINDNINDDEKDEEDDKYPDTRIGEFIQEICQFILECFDEKLEIMFFFKTCFVNLGIKFKEFRNALFAIGKAYQKFNEAQGGDDDGDKEGDDDEDY